MIFKAQPLSNQRALRLLLLLPTPHFPLRQRPLPHLAIPGRPPGIRLSRLGILGKVDIRRKIRRPRSTWQSRLRGRGRCMRGRPGSRRRCKRRVPLCIRGGLRESCGFFRQMDYTDDWLGSVGRVTSTVRTSPVTTTTRAPVSSVLPPGTVIITHNLSLGQQAKNLIPVVGGALGGVSFSLSSLMLFGSPSLRLRLFRITDLTLPSPQVQRPLYWPRSSSSYSVDA